MGEVLGIPNAAVGDWRRWPMLVQMVAAVGVAAFVLLLSAAGQAQTAGTQASAAGSSASQAADPPAPSDPAPDVTTAVQPPPAAAAEEEPAFSAAGHRDPFRPTIVIKASSVNQLPTHLPPGKPGLVIGQLALLGIVRGLNGVWIAVVDNQSKLAYFLYRGDQLYNGTVSRISPDSVVFEERFTDPVGQQKTREIVKQLSSR